MNRSNKLPDFIDVANIRNLYWNNNSDLYPQCIPTEYHRIEKTRPVFYSPYVGTCILTGEYNHCIYNGEYYFLTKLEVQDIKTGRYKYQLDYDVVINFMARGADVTGTLIKTNRPDILEGCLQTTKPILADPINKKVYDYKGTTKQTWQEKLDVKLFDLETIKNEFKEWTITKENYQEFLYRVENNLIGKECKDKEWLADTDIGRFNHHSHHNPLFVLEELPLKELPNKWKSYVAYRIAKFFEETPKTDLLITKQTSINDHFNNGGYVIGKKNEGLGTNVATEVSLSTIDLMGLTDIVPISYKKRDEEIEPAKTPSYEILPSDPRVSSPTPIYCLLRNPYLPIANDKSTEGCIPSFDTLTDNYCELGLIPGNNTPQKIITKDNDTGYLWYLNKNNLALVSTSEKSNELKPYKFFSSILTDNKTRWGYFSTKYKNIPPIGFLIYQLQKRSSEWEDIKYVGQGAENLYVRTGLSKTAIDKTYSRNIGGQWWGNVDEELLKLWGDSKPIARALLDLDLLNWLSIVPSSKNLSYKYFYENYWDLQKFIPDAGNLEKFYPSVIARQDIKWGGRTIKNPYSEEDPDNALPQWLGNRQSKLDAISIYDSIPLEVKKGDIVTTSLEHGWYTGTDWIRLVLPYEISQDEWNSWFNRDIRKDISFNDDFNVQEEVSDPSQKAIAGVTLSASIIGAILAPFTAGASVALVAALVGATAGAGTYWALRSDSISPEIQSAAINILPYLDTRYRVNPDWRDGTILLYLYEKEYRIGVYKKKTIGVELSPNDDNFIVNVDGSNTKELDITLIRPLANGRLDYKNQPVIPEDLKSEIISVGLGHHNIGTESPKRHYYSPKDLDTAHHTFDLKGTDWYLIIHDGKINFAPKTNNVFGAIPDEGEVIEIKDDVSTYAKINQKADLNFYGQIFNLNTKFSFDGTFRYMSKPLVMESQYADPEVEYKWLKVKEDNDDIDGLISISRKQTRAVDKVDASQALMAREYLYQLSTNYEQDKYANELMLGNKRQAMERQREDLDWQRKSSAVSLGLKVAGAAAGMGIASQAGIGLGKLAAAGLLSTSAMKSDVEFLIRYPTLMERINQDERDLLLTNTQQLYQRKLNYEHDFKHQVFKLNKIVGGYQRPGLSNREVQEKYNKERGVKDVSVEIYLPSPSQQREIDHIYNTFGCECVSDHFDNEPLLIRDDMEPGLYQFSKIGIDGINSPITDSTLRDIFKQILENGAKFEGCKFIVDPIDAVPTRPTIAARPKVIFDPEKVKGWSRETWALYKFDTKDKEIIEKLKNTPNYGLTDEEWNTYKDKIITDNDDKLLTDIDKIIGSRETGEIVVIGTEADPTELERKRQKQLITTLQSDIASHIAKEEEYKKQIQDLNTNYETLAEQKANKDRELEEVRTKLNTCDTKLQELRGKQTSLQTKIDEHKAEIDKKQAEIIGLKKEIDTTKTQLDECKGRISECDDRKTKVEGDITVVQGKIDALSVEKADLIKKLQDCENLVKQLQQRQDTCDRVNTQEIKRLRDQIAEQNKTIAGLNTSIVEKERDIATQTATLNNLNADKARLTEEKTRLEAEKTQLTERLNQCQTTSKDIATLQARVTTLANEIAQKNKTLGGRQRQITRLTEAKNKLEAEKAQLTEENVSLNRLLANKTSEYSELQKREREAQRQLQEETRKHKVDKESLEQQLADERRRAINEQQEINGLRKDKETLTTQLAERTKELENCMRVKDEDKPSKEKCELIKTIVDVKDEYEITDDVIDDVNYTNYKKLLVAIANAMLWMRRGSADAYMLKLAQLNNKPEVRSFINELEALQNHPDVDRMMDVLSDPMWHKLTTLLNRQWTAADGSKDLLTNIKKLFNIEPDKWLIKRLKDQLDKVSWFSYLSYYDVQEDDKLKTDQTANFFFSHIYPSTILKAYEGVYGDPTNALTRHWIHYDACTEQSNPLKDIAEIKDTVGIFLGKEYSTATWTNHPNMPTYGMKIPSLNGRQSRYPLDIHDEIFRPDITKLMVGQSMGGADQIITGRSIDGMPRSYTPTKYLEPQGGILWMLKDTWYKAYSTTVDKDLTRYVVWMKSGITTESSLWGSTEQENFFQGRPAYTSKDWYVDTGAFKNKNDIHKQVVDNIKWLLDHLDEIKVEVTDPWLDNCFIDIQHQRFDLYNLTLKDLSSRVDSVDLKSFGAMRKDLIKLLFIFSENKVTWTDAGIDSTHSYPIREPKFKTTKDIQYINNIIADVLKKIGSGSSIKRLDFDLGAHMANNLRYIHTNNKYLKDTGLYAKITKKDRRMYDQFAFPYVLLSYCYKLLGDKSTYKHPWQWDEGTIYEFFNKLYDRAQ